MSGRRRALGQLGAGLAYVPADELAQQLGAVPGADQRAELRPQIVIDPHGALGGSVSGHRSESSRCISTKASHGLTVHIYGASVCISTPNGCSR